MHLSVALCQETIYVPILTLFNLLFFYVWILVGGLCYVLHFLTSSPHPQRFAL